MNPFNGTADFGLQSLSNTTIIPNRQYHAIRPPSDDLQKKSRSPQNIKYTLTIVNEYSSSPIFL